MRLLGVLALAFVLPACGKKGSAGPAGLVGPVGPNGSNPPAPWSAPANLSQQVVALDSTAYGAQAAFSSDGRMHVVYFGYDPDTDRDQLFYTSSAAPYSTWDAPVVVTTDDVDSPLEFDLKGGTDGSVHVVFTRNNSGSSESHLYRTRNTAAALQTFTETQIYVETWDTYEIWSPRLVLRNGVAHVVWVDYDGDHNYFYSNSAVAGGWPTATPTVVDTPSNSIGDKTFAFALDAGGSIHLVYLNESGTREVKYRGISPGGSTLGSAQFIYSGDDVAWSINGPIIQFDAANNVYVFWRRNSGSGPRMVVFNRKAAAGTFDPTANADASEDPVGGEIVSTYGDDYAPFTADFDAQVAADGRVHVAWQSSYSYGSPSQYPVWYRTRNPGSNPTTGWEDAVVAGWTRDPDSSRRLWYVGRAVLVRPAADGTAHVFFADLTTLVGPDMVDLQHSYLPAGETAFRQGGSVSAPSNQAFQNANLLVNNFMLGAGVEEDGSPYVLFGADYVDVFGDGPSPDLMYTHSFAGEWHPGTDVNGLDRPYLMEGQAWVGVDPSNRLHALWPQEVDPFFNTDDYDVMHSHSPTPVQRHWTAPYRLYYP
jgi:hypothetical protein